MKTIKLLLLLIGVSFFSLAAYSIDLTITVTSFPKSTPSGAQIYIAGSFNAWNPTSAKYALQLQPDGSRTIKLINVNGIIEFKFTRAASTVEGNAQGEYLPNRTYNTANGPNLSLTIAGWEDIKPETSTANANVQILSASFLMPQLNRSRKIWLYLPNDYATANQKRYPVIYMQDGQNLFDALTSYAGEWQVDETLTSIQNAGGYGAIVVGIENGGANRIKEYSPWINTKYGGGEGDQYIDFIKNTLKPFIDQNYRTLTEQQNTGLIGSSMGGLISLYGILKYPETFGKAGIISPSIWFAKDKLLDFIASKNFTNIPLKFSFIGGTTESATLVADMQSVRTALMNAGVASQDISIQTHTDAAHSEWYWRREFGGCYQYLFPVP